jgi:hypothetical protein
VSSYVKTWLMQSAAVLAVIGAVFLREGWLVALSVALVIAATLWPRCRACGLPTFWFKRQSDPDHFIYYIGKPLSPLPRQTCARCGEDLTV